MILQTMYTKTQHKIKATKSKTIKFINLEKKTRKKRRYNECNCVFMIVSNAAHLALVGFIMVLYQTNFPFCMQEKIMNVALQNH